MDRPFSDTFRLNARVLFWLFMVMSACSRDGQRTYRPVFASVAHSRKEMVFGVPAVPYYDAANAIAGYLNERLDGTRVRAVACISVEDYENKLRNGYFDFTVINGPQLLMAEERGYTVVAKIAEEYRSMIVVNKDSAVHGFADLRNRTICLGGRRIMAGDVMPLLFLYKHGVDVNKRLKRLYSPSYESALMNVCLGRCSVGAVWGTAYRNFCNRRPELASRLSVKWVTPSLASAGLLLRWDVNRELSKKLAGLFCRMGEDTEGRRALKLMGLRPLEPADSSMYLPMKKMLREYDELIH
jgi:ABC-type phosphate/phosphonate transport system substrate-binding protein